MLTNCHTLILRRLLGHGAEPPPAERDLYLYNIAPDNLPLSGEFSARETHRFVPPAGALERFPKLVWVRCHIAVDNLCHYGELAKPAGRAAPSEKRGYAYRSGAGLIPLLDDFAGEMEADLDAPTALYLGHILVEIAVDYAIYRDDRSVPLTLRASQEAMDPAQKREYFDGLAVLYGCSAAQIERTRGAAARFYGNTHDIDYLFLEGRTKIVLRKLGLPFSAENIGCTKDLIREAADAVSDYTEFIDFSVERLSDRDGWAGEEPLESEEP